MNRSFAFANARLEVGSGSGLFEQLLYEHSEGTINIYGVEVPSCVNKYLPADRMLRVPDTRAVHADVVMAETILFVYPRSRALIAQYLCGKICMQLVVITSRAEYGEVGDLIANSFSNIDFVLPYSV